MLKTHFYMAISLALLIVLSLSAPFVYARDGFRFEGFVDQHGQAITPEQIASKQYVLVNFIFTACSNTCGLQTKRLVEIQHQLPTALKNKVQMISISVDPLRDTPKVLLAYANRYQADLSNWSFIVGNQQAFDRIREEFAVFRRTLNGEIKDINQHTSDVCLFDSNDRFLMRYHINNDLASRLIEDLKNFSDTTAP